MSEWGNIVKDSLLEAGTYSYNELSCEVKLNQNESPFDIPAALKQEITEEVCRSHWNRYPSLTGTRLKLELSSFLGLPEKCIVVGVGSDEMLNAAASVVLEKNKSALRVEPTFQLYKQCAVSNGANEIVLQLNSDFSYPVEEIVRVLKNRKVDLFMLASPNSPTGNSLNLTDLEIILKSTDGLVVIDEAYYEFSGITAVSLLKKYRNLVITRTFSKAFGLAGLRVGYLLSDPDIVENIYKVKMPFSLNVFSEAAAITLLRNYGEIRKNIDTILKNKQSLINILRESTSVTVYPSDTNFFIIDVKQNGEKTAQDFADAGVAVRDVSHYPLLENCIRVTVGTEKENKIFSEVLKKICHEKTG